MKNKIPLLPLLLLCLACSTKESNKWYLLIGTYTSDNGGKGIYTYTFDKKTTNTEQRSVTQLENPSFLTISKDGNYVYAISENNTNNSAVHSFHFNKDNGTLTPIAKQPTLASAPCYVSLDEENNYLYTANYGGGSISSFPLKAKGQILKIDSLFNYNTESEKSHIHCVLPSPDNRILFATDLGRDRIYSFKLSNKGLLNTHTAIKLPKGTGIRHLTFHPNKKWAYGIGEISGKVFAFEYTNNTLKSFQSIEADTIPAHGSADIHISPNGKFLYASNRLQNDGIAIFSIANTGKLTKIGYQPTAKHPRNFAISPNGQYLLVASRDENKVQIFTILKSGLLKNTGKEIIVPKPVCLKLISEKQRKL